jgi:sugar phosphate isomerase/epimerase
MFKISAFPKCWIEELCSGKRDLIEWIDMSVSLECEGLELMDGFLQSRNEAYLLKIRNYIESKGMVVSMLCYSPDFTRPAVEEREEEIKKQQEIIRVADKLGVKFVRTLSGQKRPRLNTEEAISWVVDCIRRCLPVAEKYGINLVMENHYKDGFWTYSEFAQKMELFLRIVNQIDSPFFGIQFDPSNSVVAGENPLVLLDKVVNRVKTMHASDRYIEPGYRVEEVLAYSGREGYHPALKHGVIGKGLNDYPTMMKKLAAAGFNGWISIEDGMNGLDEMKESIDFLKKMRKEYFLMEKGDAR